MSENVTAKVSFKESVLPSVLGQGDKNLRSVRDAMNVRIAVLGGECTIEGKEEDVDRAVKLLEHLRNMAEKGELCESGVNDAIRMMENEESSVDVSGVLLESIKVGGRVKSVSPKSSTQMRYVQSIRDNDLVFGTGPAGTGKTYLAMAMAVHLFLHKKVGRIILTRPAVEAGENLGFLPGDIQDKINPYLRPLYDALYSMMNFEQVSTLIEKNIIEVAPLAFMRGRTLNDSFIVLDEAQNTTSEQMKMFLTRLGFRSKAVVTGDITQVDLPSNKKSGLILVRDILRGVPGINFVDFSQKDVVRHNLVQKIIEAYDRHEEQGK
ncbi:PhoH family protein [Limisalsivibrio acetivorans]|uniref:PhoH family protein n=1 Tax=Limisalsivibrio acetivorans TaxID=1304888 RepID=UPI0003B4CF40|nr:PhoH family protein [Limisalsivibrio acetivorans]